MAYSVGMEADVARAAQLIDDELWQEELERLLREVRWGKELDRMEIESIRHAVLDKLKARQQKVQEELENLTTVVRPEIAADLAAARELGDLSENAEYWMARDAREANEERIKVMEDLLETCRSDGKPSNSLLQVWLGATWGNEYFAPDAAAKCILSGSWCWMTWNGRRSRQVSPARKHLVWDHRPVDKAREHLPPELLIRWVRATADLLLEAGYFLHAYCLLTYVLEQKPETESLLKEWQQEMENGSYCSSAGFFKGCANLALDGCGDQYFMAAPGGMCRVSHWQVEKSPLLGVLEEEPRKYGGCTFFEVPDNQSALVEWCIHWLMQEPDDRLGEARCAVFGMLRRVHPSSRLDAASDVVMALRREGRNQLADLTASFICQLAGSSSLPGGIPLYDRGDKLEDHLF